jgi:AcrR family transcriptional regulator
MSSIIRSMAAVKARRYRTSIRRGDAPQLICAAAYRLFSTKGYLATSIDDIAAEAKVARPTVFSAVGAKPVILKAVVDQAAVGDAAPMAVADRPWWQEALDEPDPHRSVALHARNMCRIQQRIVPLMKAVEAAASVDPDAAEIWARYERQRRSGMGDYIANLRTKTALRCDADTATDTLWTLAPDAYWRLVHSAGWPLEKYERWLADLMQRVLLD